MNNKILQDFDPFERKERQQQHITTVHSCRCIAADDDIQMYFLTSFRSNRYRPTVTCSGSPEVVLAHDDLIVPEPRPGYAVLGGDKVGSEHDNVLFVVEVAAAAVAPTTILELKHELPDAGRARAKVLEDHGCWRHQAVKVHGEAVALICIRGERAEEIDITMIWLTSCQLGQNGPKVV